MRLTFFLHALLRVLAAALLADATLHRAPRQSDGTSKLVVAHHIVGLTASYTIDDWKADITLAQSSGVDGFALNVGTDSWQVTQVASA